MRTTTGRDSDRVEDNTTRRMTRIGFCAVVVGAVARLAWLAAVIPPGGESPNGASKSHRVAVCETEKPSVETGRLSAADLAALSAVCPVGLEALPQHLLPSGSPKARITGIRLASRAERPEVLRGALAAPRGEGDGWLVPPEEWYAPEDRAPIEPEPDALGVNDAELGSSSRVSVEKVEAESPAEAFPAPIDADAPGPERETLPSPPYAAEPVAATDAAAKIGPSLAPVGKEPATPSAAEPSFGETGIAAPLFDGPGPGAAPEPIVSAELLPKPPPAPRSSSTPAPSTGLTAAPSMGPSAGPHHGGRQAAEQARTAAGGRSADESHAELFARNSYPSALDCAECHQAIYDEWSVSSHAYAFVSPMFHVFEQKITDLSQGTVGYFCQRCHSPVATSLGYARTTPIGEMPVVAREGVTCVACHRVNQRFAKSNGERHLVPGDIYQPVYGGVGGDGVAEVIAQRDRFKVKLSDSEKSPGQAMHREGRFFDQLTRAEACTSCHQVAVHPGIKLEVVWEQYRQSPACEKGVTCQECHMGRVPGVASPLRDRAPIAEVGGQDASTTNRERSPTICLLRPRLLDRPPRHLPVQHKDGNALDGSTSGSPSTGGPAGAPTTSRTPSPTRGIEARSTSAWSPTVLERERTTDYDAREIIRRQPRAARQRSGDIRKDGDGERHQDRTGRTSARRRWRVAKTLKFDYVVTNIERGPQHPRPRRSALSRSSGPTSC